MGFDVEEGLFVVAEVAGVIGVEDGDAALGFGGEAVPEEDVSDVSVAVEDGGDLVGFEGFVEAADIARIPFALEGGFVVFLAGAGVAGDIDMVGDDDGAAAGADVFGEVADEEIEAVESGVAAVAGDAAVGADDEAEVDEG